MQILNILILVGAIQGFISSALLFFSKKGSKLSNQLLGVLILLLSLACFNLYIMEVGLRYKSSVVNVASYVIPMIIVMPIGPLIYFYTRSLLQPGFKLRSEHAIHFYPVVLDLIPYVAGSIYMIGLKADFVTILQGDALKNLKGILEIYTDIPRWISISIYLHLSAKVIACERVEHQQPDQLRWLKQFIGVFTSFQGIWLLHLIPYVIPASQATLLSLVDWYPIYIPIAVIVYWLGINGYMISGDSASSGKKGNSQLLASGTISQTEAALKDAMQTHRLFLDPLLTLDVVVKHTGISQKVISRVLNQHMGKSFNEFVNTYRVEELQKRLLETGNGHLTITGLALECGFNSPATLQRTFKQLTKRSPREYLLAHQPSKQKKTANTAQI